MHQLSETDHLLSDIEQAVRFFSPEPSLNRLKSLQYRNGIKLAGEPE